MSFDPVYHDAILLTLIWAGYFIIHSLLASLTVKGWVADRNPDFMPMYRLMFNFIAIVLLAAPLWVLFTGQRIMLWDYQGWLFWLTNSIAALALIAFMVSLKYYDGSEFLGLRQLKAQEKSIEDQEHLHLSPFHRYVRHPWYCFALILIWTRPMDSLMLVSAVFMSLYFFIGSRLEEKKLVQYYGRVYEHYISKVPGLFPLPWKHLTTSQVNELMDEYRQNKTG
jgi:protein-S-isoprenylcysteine O-methyltransferase Ste14